MVLLVAGYDGVGQQKMDRKILDVAGQLKSNINKFFLCIRLWSKGVIK
jgi:hypothetical protein